MADPVQEEEGFGADVKIDKGALDEENIRQGSLVFKWGKKYAEAEWKMNKAEDALKISKAEAARDIRKDPAKFSVSPKCTAEEMKEAVEVNEKVRAAASVLIDAKKTFAIMNVGYNAIVQKGYSLSNLGRLFENDYFSVSKAVHQTLNETMTRRFPNEEGGKAT
jgi:hypothetical protein